MRKNGFTLIELLVVIAIIAILLSVLIPSLNKAKLQVRSVICRSNLRQWGMVWKLYSDENESKFPYWKVINAQYHRGAWIQPLRQYLPEREKILLCPAASRKNPDGLQANGSYGIDTYGGTFTSYSMGMPTGAEIAQGITEPEWCSYGMNTWCTSSGGDTGSNQNRPAEKLWGTFEKVRSPSSVPLMLDSMWRGGAPQTGIANAISPPQSEGQWRGYNYEISHFAIPRHGKGTVNCLYVDLHVDGVKIRDLWSQKWYEDYNRGYTPQWPEWMNKYK